MPQQIRFGTFLLDPENEQLTRAGDFVNLRPKAFLLLEHLARRPGELATKEALLDALWPGVHVSDAVLKVAIGELRRALGDAPRTPTLIETVHRRGYRFIGDSQLVERPESSLPIAVSTETPHADADSDHAPRTTPTSRTSVRLPSLRKNSRSTDFVGREDALTLLSESWQQAQQNQPGIVLITGRAGIGKSRLITEFLRIASDETPVVASARGADRDALPGFFIWSQILASISPYPALQKELSKLNRNDEVVRAFPSVVANRHASENRRQATASQQSVSEDRFELFEEISSFLERCSTHSPLVIVLEDLHWADALSLRLLEHVLCEIKSARILFLVTLRDGAPGLDRPIDRTVALLRRMEWCAAIALAGLSRETIGQLFSTAIGRPASSALSDQIFERTEGVPFFVWEAIRLHKESSDFHAPERASRDLPLPERTADLLNHSLDQLSEGARSLLEAGAVLGREFSLTQAAAILKTPREEALDQAEEAISAGVLADLETTVATYRFSHALFREAVYDGLSVARRARLHQRAAARLESQYEGALAPVLSELAHHLHRGIAVADPERCYAIATEAGFAASQRIAYEEAALHYEQAFDALNHCDRVDPEVRLATLLSIGHSHRLAGEHRRRRDAFRRAIDAARSVGAARELAQAAIGFCNLAEWAPDDAEGLEIIEEALAGLSKSAKDADWSVERARLTARLAYLRAEDREKATPLAVEAVELARTCGDAEALQESLYARRFIAVDGANPEDSKKDLLDMINSAKRSPNKEPATLAALYSGYLCLTEGNLSACETLRMKAGSLVGSALNLRWYLAAWDTGISLMKGEFGSAEAHAVEALSMGQRTQHPFAAAIFNGHMAQIARERGDSEELVRRLQPALQGRLGATHWIRAVVARGQVDLGENDDARALLEELAVDHFAGMIANRRSLGTLPEVAFLAVELRDEERSAKLLDHVRSAPNRHGVFAGVVNYAGPYLWCEARLESFLAGPQVGLPLYPKALAAAQRMGALPTAARICLDWAERAAEAGEVDSALQQAAAAESLAVQLGMHGLKDRAASLRARFGHSLS